MKCECGAEIKYYSRDYAIVNYNGVFTYFDTNVCLNGHVKDDYPEFPKEEYVRNKIYLSLGGGLQSSLIAIMIANKDNRLKQYWGAEAVFSDTGAEQKATYNYLYSFLMPYLIENGMNVYVIRKENGLLPYFMEKKHVPLGWANPLCSSWTKKDNIHSFYRWRHGRKNKNGKLYLSGKDIHITEIIGITTDEITRVNSNTGLNWLSRVYPLVDLGLSRSDLYNIYEEYEITPPPKSGCWMCPNAGWHRFSFIQQESKEKFAVLLQMEENSARINPNNPPTFIYGKSLNQLKGQLSLLDYLEEDFTSQMCGSSCMT